MNYLQIMAWWNPEQHAQPGWFYLIYLLPVIAIAVAMWNDGRQE